MLRRNFVKLFGLIPLSLFPKSDQKILDSVPKEWATNPHSTKKLGQNWYSTGGYSIKNTGKLGVPNVFKWRNKLIRIPHNHMMCGNEYSDGTCYVSVYDMSTWNWLWPIGQEVQSWGSFEGKV